MQLHELPKGFSWCVGPDGLALDYSLDYNRAILLVWGIEELELKDVSENLHTEFDPPNAWGPNLHDELAVTPDAYVDFTFVLYA